MKAISWDLWDVGESIINSLISQKDDEKIVDVLRIINCLAYYKYSSGELDFPSLDTLLNSKFKGYLIYLLEKQSSIPSDTILNSAFEIIISSEIINLMGHPGELNAEGGWKNPESIINFVSSLYLFRNFHLKN
ncbi:unnamed protein product [Blepharisma stoltei]|uniref:Uncharacterized protein n=1 Tax=Blepharisma stoltei TaxID=1481888 RepID=A0AAU9KA32_9CILI|nr:unnamed protein product [Blepharisma stoltei]